MKSSLVFLFLLMAIMQNVVMAQDGIDQTETIRLNTEGWKAINNKNYREAIQYFTKNLNGPKETEALKGLSQSHYHLEEYNIAAQYFKQLDSKGMLDKNEFLNYARCLIYMREFTGLNAITEKYENENPNWFTDIEFKSLQKFIALRQPHFSLKNSRIKVTPFHEINSYNSDYAPALHNEMLYFVSDRTFSGNSNNTEDSKYRLLSAKANGDNLKEDKRLITDKLHYGPLSFSKDYIFYSATNKMKKNADKPNNPDDEITLYPAIYYKKIGGKDVDEKPLLPNSFSKFALLDPHWDDTSQTIYFASDMPNGYGGLDLYYQQLNKDGRWSKPTNLGPEINTEGNERSPYVMDSLIYFASDGHIGFGKLDIFKTVKLDSVYSIPENLGFGVNSNQDDFSFILDPSNADLGLFATNRVGGRGSEDIYKVDFSASRSAKIVIQALDWETQKQVDLSNIKIFDKNGSRVNFERWKSGNSYNLEVFQLGEIVIQLNAYGYMPQTDIQLTLTDFSESIPLEFSMFPLEMGRVITLIEDGFEEEYSLSPEAREKLRNFYAEVKHLSYLSFTVIAHTDSQGFEDTNIEISLRQAELVRDYFGNLGFDVRFINVLGRGGKDPINDCIDGKPCTEDKYAQNRRIQIRFDDFFVE